MIRHTTPQGLALIKHFEGGSAVPYRCPGGMMTIGYGHVIRPGETFPEPLSQEEAEILLRRDLSIAEHAVLRLIQVPLSDGQFDALVSFTFNLGAGSLQRSTLRRKINREDHAEAPPEFLKWCRAGGRKLPGLLRRRKAEALLYRS